MPSFGLIRGFDLPPANAARDPAALLVALDGYRLDVDPRRRLVLVVERRLRFEQVTGIFKDNSRVGTCFPLPLHQGLTMPSGKVKFAGDE